MFALEDMMPRFDNACASASLLVLI